MITLSEEERIQKLKKLLGFDTDYAIIKCHRVEWSEVEALLSRDQAPEVCECAHTIQARRRGDEWWECGSCGKRIKETPNEQ